ncbi:Crp/Fnr family transcriptional regulator [Flavihumibacter rivuli]|uniref:Crp/Fnr family transcriptional regulator n=1 Tax=Flavihumibacter rivuli TaxID=2838156 RepID=UPI001BDE69D4|nr:Crp/Fnr family transcriptional regulator [Flavihumibacter rivuli]ULQ58389.1 Crp/Fnr family transcriptional regulator [Flavihumibacter rivuli]
MSDTTNTLEIMRRQISALHPIPDEEWESFSSIWVPVTYKRKSVLTAAGEVEKYLYWVTEGVQRGFHLHNEKEATIVFSYPYSFSGIIDSFLLQKPSRFYLECITSSQFLRTTYQQYEQVRRTHAGLGQAMYLALAAAMSGVLERQIELMVYSAEEKFRTLLKRSPHILQIVPHKYLASYLGIDPTTFSKLLSTVKIS